MISNLSDAVADKQGRSSAARQFTADQNLSCSQPEESKEQFSRSFDKSEIKMMNDRRHGGGGGTSILGGGLLSIESGGEGAYDCEVPEMAKTSMFGGHLLNNTEPPSSPAGHQEMSIQHDMEHGIDSSYSIKGS